MKSVRLVWTALLRLLFPLPKHLGAAEHITLHKLEQGGCTERVEAPFPCLAALRYRNTNVRSCVHAAKYHGHERAATLLGTALAPILAEELAERHAFQTYTEPLVIPIPLHKEKLRTRGFNQADRIAASMCASLRLSDSLVTDVLMRTHATAPQARTTSRTERYRNMRHAFSVPDPAVVRHRDIVLVDDVITTGATFAAAREVLLRAGARDVLCVAAAH